MVSFRDRIFKYNEMRRKYTGYSLMGMLYLLLYALLFSIPWMALISLFQDQASQIPFLNWILLGGMFGSFLGGLWLIDLVYHYIREGAKAGKQLDDELKKP